jgi:hypothetical protein
MLAVLRYDATCREHREESSHRLTHYGHAIDALVTAPRHDEYLAGALGLLHSQPRLGALDRIRGRRQRGSKIQRPCSPESQLVERVLQ